MKVTMAEKLTALMKEQKISVKEIAKATDLPYLRISALLSWDGRSPVDVSTVMAVKDYFGVSLEQLLDDRIVYPFSDSPVEEQLPCDQPEPETKYIELYNLPVSAGTGIYVEDSGTEMIQVALSEKTKHASFALRVRGNSMSPVYHDRDLILIGPSRLSRSVSREFLS